MDRNNINKIANTPEDRILLAKLWDKIQAGMRKNIIANTCFLSPRELDMSRYLFGREDTLIAFGGYAEAERKMLIYMPEYLDENYLYSEYSPLVCIHGSFHENYVLSHRDILGALMGSGISRDTIGDICLTDHAFDFFVTAEIAPYIMQNLSSSGRAKLELSYLPLTQFSKPEEKTTQIKDTVASLRLDSLIASGFLMGRSAAAQYISAGKASIDGLPCEKPDKTVSEGSKISVRGLGKIRLTKINGETKKGRTSVVIDRYI